MELTALEHSCLRTFRSGELPPPARDGNLEDILRVGLWLMLRIGSMVRERRWSAFDIHAKSDGSPVTSLELDIEAFARNSLSLLPEGTAFVSEEAGGELPATGFALVLDPIDGTRSFLSQSDNFAVSIAFYQNGKPMIGMVMNPATGDLAYVVNGGSTRWMQLAFSGEREMGYTLPVFSLENRPLLIHVHPSRKAAMLLQRLNEQWESGAVQFVKAAGGSPSYALADAAKGHFLYVNMWDHRPAAPYDLAAGALIVRGAGGEVFDGGGQPIAFAGHRGPFIAGCWNERRLQFLPVLLDLINRG